MRSATATVTIIVVTIDIGLALLHNSLSLAWTPHRNNNKSFPTRVDSISGNWLQSHRQQQQETEHDKDHYHDHDSSQSQLFQEFVVFLQSTQATIIQQLEEMDGSGETFTNDTWGTFAIPSEGTSGGITRVLQGGSVIEKGACSLTLLPQGILSAERATAIQSRQDSDVQVQAGDIYSAAALSIVLHSKSPMVPTFRSDVRLFLTSNKLTGTTKAWFGGGADLTPYYLNTDNIKSFHQHYQQLADHQHHHILGYDYASMKQACDDYFYLIARSEHRGTGGIFFDDMEATESTLQFVKAVANAWMPSWLPIVEQHRHTPYTEKQRYWQLLRRGRYLEFNLLYDRGVKFGLANVNPRVEGVMVSAPPLIAWEYNHTIEKGSEEQKLMDILKTPIDWI